MKQKWYLQTWFIAICFALWPLYGIPVLVGILLIILQKKALKKAFTQSQNTQSNSNTAKSEQTGSADDHVTAKDKIKCMKAEYQKQTSDYKVESQKDKETITKLRNEITVLQDKSDKLEKQCVTQERKLRRSKELYKSVDYAINNFFNTQTAYSNCKLSTRDLEDYDLLVPSVILKLHCMDIKDLRRTYKEVEKQINIVLSQYSSRYTTKANQSIYQLMVIALQAELQNILYALKYEKLDTAIEQVKKMTAKYLKIAGEGNQSIAGTLTKFIGEIEYLFIDAVKIEYNYYIKKEQARQEQLALKEQMRQEAEEQKALALERKRIEQEELKFNNEIEKLQDQMQTADASEMDQLKTRILQLQAQLSDVAVKKKDIANLQNGKAGNIYIISNLGAFGENMFKIGMTRRINPLDRIDELGSASVPFKFDVHSFIFSDDAVDLENKLHTRLNNQRVNKVNRRKEFFYSSVDELEALVQEIDPTAEFNRTMIAEEFRQSQSSETVYTDDYVDSLADDAE